MERLDRHVLTHVVAHTALVAHSHEKKCMRTFKYLTLAVSAGL